MCSTAEGLLGQAKTIWGSHSNNFRAQIVGKSMAMPCFWDLAVLEDDSITPGELQNPFSFLLWCEEEDKVGKVKWEMLSP